MSVVEQAAGLFSSIAASPVGVSARGLAALAEEHGLDGERLIDALAFLEASGMIEVISLVRVSEHARLKREAAQSGSLREEMAQ